MTFKTNFKLIALATSIAALSFTSVSNAADTQEARATIIWNGLIGSTVPGTNLKITGAGGSDIADGTLYVKDDGTFTSSSVIIEARDYSVANDVETIGDVQPDASWTFASSQVMMNGQMTADAEIIVKDIISNQVFTQGGESAGSEITAGRLNLEIVNNEAVDDVEVAGEVQVAVLMSASYEAAL